jgi:hypothetical protein
VKAEETVLKKNLALNAVAVNIIVALSLAHAAISACQRWIMADV